MKILKMKLENFQGVKELEIDPQGESSAIYGITEPARAPYTMPLPG